MSNNFPGGLIRKTPVTPAGPLQNGAAPGMWTLAEASFWTKQGLWPIAGNVLAVEDVFSTYLYTGNGATQTITTGIDLAGKGGMLWIKNRSAATNNIISDTVRGAGNFLQSNASSQQFFNTANVSALSSTGFSVGVDSNTNGTPGNLYASWTFREAPNFFDVVTYTGTGANRTIAHNLGVAPGMIIVKRTDTAADWQVYHRSNANTQYMVLNDTATVATGATRWNSTTPTATEFSVGTDTTVNASGGTYVAYLFAHDTSSTGIIQCGSYAGAYPASPTVTLGWEPQWVMIKAVTNSNVYTNWGIWDNMRGMPVGGNDPLLDANRDTQEGTTYTDTGDYLSPTATGFIVDPAANGWSINNTGSVTYIYMAIRRGPMRTPTLGTSVFSPTKQTSTGYTQITGINFAPDFVFQKAPSDGGDGWNAVDKLRGPSASLAFNAAGAEVVDTQFFLGGFLNSGVKMGTASNGQFNGYNPNSLFFFQRAPGFMDVVCYTGTGVARTVSHNLGVVPELIIVKCRSASDENWLVQSTYILATQRLSINLNSEALTAINFNNTYPTSAVFSLGEGVHGNLSARTYVAYLFASCPGVSKVGSYTGNGSSQTINCAFTTGARFVLIKRTDSTGDWYVWDSARGIVAGNDPYLALNTTAAEVTSNDSVDTDNTGFVVNQVAASNINVNAATYIFLAIA